MRLKCKNRAIIVPNLYTNTWVSQLQLLIGKYIRLCKQKLDNCVKISNKDFQSYLAKAYTPCTKDAIVNPTQVEHYRNCNISVPA